MRKSRGGTAWSAVDTTARDINRTASPGYVVARGVACKGGSECGEAGEHDLVRGGFCHTRGQQDRNPAITARCGARHRRCAEH